MDGTDQIQQYGYSSDLFVSRKEGDQTLVLGGMGQQERWAHPMTRRAAMLLWFKLTSLLYPDKAEMVTALATTAPLRNFVSMTVTTHCDVVHSGPDQYTVAGWLGSRTWRMLLTEAEGRRLWAMLDMALFPVGWEGRSIRPQQLN